MGQYLSYIDKTTKAEPDIPEYFIGARPDNWNLFFAIFDVSYESIPLCDCPPDVPADAYACLHPTAIRPTDFKAYREKLEEKHVLHSQYPEIVDYLEKNPNVYVDFE